MFKTYEVTTKQNHPGFYINAFGVQFYCDECSWKGETSELAKTKQFNLSCCPLCDNPDVRVDV
ncbi:hypothetical protein L9G16_00355 [Shewanella sp. A25]|nr:hypothetical protein [Shewanella shenzhenensis]